LPLLEALEAWSKPGIIPESLCRIGEWRCWARRGSRDGPRVELPIETWKPSQLALEHPISRPGELRIIDENLLCRYKLKKVPEKQRDGEIKVFERLVTVEIWYDPVFVPVAGPRAQSLEAKFKQWLAGLDYIPSLPECRTAFPGEKRDTMRDLKRVHAPSRRGRPRTKIGD
jgi:hypothetical protein